MVRSAAPEDPSLSVTMTAGANPCFRSNFLSSFSAAALSRLRWINTSRTSPSLSTARHIYIRCPPIETTISSRCPRNKLLNGHLRQQQETISRMIVETAHQRRKHNKIAVASWLSRPTRVIVDALMRHAEIGTNQQPIPIAGTVAREIFTSSVSARHPNPKDRDATAQAPVPKQREGDKVITSGYLLAPHLWMESSQRHCDFQSRSVEVISTS